MIRHIVFDLDGVLYRDTEPTPHVVRVLQELRARGARLAFLTNNSSRHRREVAERLRGFGLEADDSEVYSSSYATALYLRSHRLGEVVFVVGERGIIEELSEQDITVTSDFSAAQVVVVGWDRGIDFDKLAGAHRAIMGGASFIATNGDKSFPLGGGVTVPGAGALVAALRESTGVVPLVIGKPMPTGMQLIADQWSVGPTEVAAVGDRLDTDIAAANAFGCRSILVLTGITTREQAEQATGAESPDVVIQDLAELASAL